MSSDRSNFLFLWHSVSAQIRSGYGGCTRHIVGRLAKKGFRFVTTHYYGIDPGGVLVLNGVPALPAKTGSFGELSVRHYVNTLKPNMVWLHTDPWAFPWMVSLPCLTGSYGPLDHILYPENLQQLMRQYNYRVAPAKFTVEEWAKYDPPVYFDWIPHGVETSVYKPMDKAEAKRFYKIDPESFVMGMVGANSDKEPRKGWTLMFKAIRMFLDNNPDVRNFKCVVYTNPKDQRGIDIELFLKKYKLTDISVTQSPFLFETGIKDEEMARLYNAFDVLLHASYREGFGLCMYEAMSCGVPVIAHDFSSMTEAVVEENGTRHGWLAKTAVYVDTPIGATSAIPDVYSIEKCIEKAYFRGKTRLRYARNARKFALKFDWDRIVNEMWTPYLDRIIEENRPKDLSKRKLV